MLIRRSPNKQPWSRSHKESKKATSTMVSKAGIMRKVPRPVVGYICKVDDLVERYKTIVMEFHTSTKLCHSTYWQQTGRRPKQTQKPRHRYHAPNPQNQQKHCHFQTAHTPTQWIHQWIPTMAKMFPGLLETKQRSRRRPCHAEVLPDHLLRWWVGHGHPQLTRP